MFWKLFLLLFCGVIQLKAQLAKPDTLIPGIGSLNHPVSTKSKDAQQFFNQGLTLVYGFNHEAAYISFEQALKEDPGLAMAYWGMALSLGPNINTPINLEREKKAFNLIQKGLKLAFQSKNITENEKDYIQTLSLRYTDESNPDFKQLEQAYSVGMKQLMQKYEEDLDAATLYAESAMNLSPWALWTKEGIAVPGTEEIVSVLESVLRRDPDHIGANHYYIHAVEGSLHPERALISAERLPILVPASGHLLHMPSHIYLLVGDYHKAVVMNEDAVRVDNSFMQANGSTFYVIHYMSHNLYFLSRAAVLEGNYQKAIRAADDLKNLLKSYISKMPDLEYYMTGSLLTDLRFGKWDKVLATEKPDESMQGFLVLWYFARSIAFSHLHQISEAEEAKKIFLLQKKQSEQNASFGYNSLGRILEIAQHYLEGTLARASGDFSKAIDHLKMAVNIQDELKYNEPPDWFFSVRESLGATLYQAQDYKQAYEVLKEDLKRHPRNGRSLFALLHVLKAQNRQTDAFWVEEEFKKAWKYADTELNMNEL